MRSKCIPVLYRLDAAPIKATDFKQHPITNISMILFHTKSAEVVTECQQAFGFQPIRKQINRQKIKFPDIYITSPNLKCTIAYKQCVVNEIQHLSTERLSV